jgi:hypothetical protein
LAGTRWAHFNYNNKKARRLAEETNSEKIDITTRANKIHREDELLTTFSVPALGSIGSSRDGGHK